jgi:hypothetical protein
MDGEVMKESGASPNESTKSAGNPVAGRPAEGGAGREEKLIRLYMELTECSETEARSTYMHVNTVGNEEAGGKR